jgi:multicomponent Na+:H+ antiporter subunit G
MNPFWVDSVTVVLVVCGALFFFAGWVGMLRFPDPLSRLHALSKADNLGLGLVVIGLLPQASWPFGGLKLIALWLVVQLIGGATSQMLAGAIHADAGAAAEGTGRDDGSDGGSDGGSDVCPESGRDSGVPPRRPA